jgi:hypothetical protein
MYEPEITESEQALLQRVLRTWGWNTYQLKEAGSCAVVIVSKNRDAKVPPAGLWFAEQVIKGGGE